MNVVLRCIILMVSAAMLGMGAAGCDSGESPTGPAIPPSQEDDIGSQKPISDSDLEKAVAAYSEIQAINRQLQESVQRTQDPNERQRLQVEANYSMAKAIENAGLDFETYNNILNQIGNNPALHERFQRKIQVIP